MFSHARRCAMYLLAASTTLSGAAAFANDERPDVRQLMTEDEYRAAGLEKLEPAEIDSLNRWLLRYTAKDAPQMREHSEVVREEIERVDAEGIRTRIAGEFRGWDGETLFRMENGQTWKQRLPGRWFHRASSPEVELRKNFMGYWEMRVVEANRAIGVKRID
jgi:hypothetical protein